MSNPGHSTYETTQDILNKENQEMTITEDEIVDAIRAIETGKAEGSDELAPELIKWSGKENTDWITQKLKKSWIEHRLDNTKIKKIVDRK
ncbi:hypothetical protein QE152_g26502 [Popillia japonica]|uniref:Uncharacterized protein n=1 Tax=Popillia japonica TaxID=7064 RepID=A0AAW1JX23_POPJA